MIIIVLSIALTEGQEFVCEGNDEIKNGLSKDFRIYNTN